MVLSQKSLDSLREKINEKTMYRKGAELVRFFNQLGFNEQSSHNIINIKSCPMLESKLNDILPMLHNFMEEFCSLKITIKNKKKLETYTIKNGTVNLLSADNGIDIVLTIYKVLNLKLNLFAT